MTLPPPPSEMESVDLAYDLNLEWVHCNRCYRNPHVTNSSHNSKQIPFFLTQCGHIICQICLLGSEESSHNIELDCQRSFLCPVCKNDCLIVILKEQLAPEIEKFFAPALSHLEESIQIFKFQYSNAVKLLKFLKEKIMKQNDLLQRVKLQMQAVKEREQSYQAIQKENAELKSQLAQLRKQNFESNQKHLNIFESAMTNSRQKKNHSPFIKDLGRKTPESNNWKPSPGARSLNNIGYPPKPARLSFPPGSCTGSMGGSPKPHVQGRGVLNPSTSIPNYPMSLPRTNTFSHSPLHTPSYPCSDTHLNKGRFYDLNLRNSYDNSYPIRPATVQPGAIPSRRPSTVDPIRQSWKQMSGSNNHHNRFNSYYGEYSVNKRPSSSWGA